MAVYVHFNRFVFAVTFYDGHLVLHAFILTAAVFLGLTAYTLQSKRDFSKFGAGLFACLWILCLAGFLKVSSLRTVNSNIILPVSTQVTLKVPECYL